MRKLLLPKVVKAVIAALYSLRCMERIAMAPQIILLAAGPNQSRLTEIKNSIKDIISIDVDGNNIKIVGKSKEALDAARPLLDIKKVALKMPGKFFKPLMENQCASLDDLKKDSGVLFIETPSDCSGRVLKIKPVTFWIYGTEKSIATAIEIVKFHMHMVEVIPKYTLL